MFAYLVILVAVGAVSIAGVGMTQHAQEPAFWAFVEVVQSKDTGQVLWINTAEETRLQYVEVNEPMAIKDVVDLSGYSNYEILECSYDTCSTMNYDKETILHNHDRLKVVVSSVS